MVRPRNGWTPETLTKALFDYVGTQQKTISLGDPVFVPICGGEPSLEVVALVIDTVNLHPAWEASIFWYGIETRNILGIKMRRLDVIRFGPVRRLPPLLFPMPLPHKHRLSA
jgi:hypothetical protein